MDHRIGRWLFLQYHCLILKQVELNIIVVSIIASQLSCQKEKKFYFARKCQVWPNKCQIKLNCLQELLGSLSMTLSNYDLYICWVWEAENKAFFTFTVPCTYSQVTSEGNFILYTLEYAVNTHSCVWTQQGLLAGGGESGVVLLRHKNAG